MSPKDPANSPPPDEDSYNESSDEDFDPTATAPGADGDVISSDDDADDAPDNAAKKPAKGKRKRAANANEEAEDVGFENSGDEAIVKRGSKRKKKQAGGEGDGDESGGEGGFVKTRRMRASAAEEQARRPLATTEGSTIDVDALWTQMNDPNASRRLGPQREELADPEERPKDGDDKYEEKEPPQERADDLIEIEETYTFAGEVQVAKKLVPRSSSEAQKWLKEHPDGAVTNDHADSESAATSKAKRHPESGEPLLRPLRRISLWDPNPSGVVKGLPTNILADSDAGNRLRVVDKSRLGWHTEDAAPQKNAKATKKVNVVEKSKMDWVAHVAAMGDKEELDKAAKAKGNFLERRDFLERVEARKDEDERRVRVK